MAQFEIRDLSFSYPANPDKMALDHVTMSVGSGQYIAICGKSGSGKTTLLRHLKTVLTPHGKRSGDVLFCGRPLEKSDLRIQSSQIGYVMQDPDSQIVTDKVWHELAFGLESLGTEQRTMRARVAEMASYFGIQGWFHRDVAELSGGQKQLLNLASIMAMQPSVLILDEPTSQLDPVAANDFLNTVRKINLELGTTILITEHRLEDIYHAADRVVVMENGRITADDDPRKVAACLRRENSEMFAAMPSPVQIYYGVAEQRVGRERGSQTDESPVAVDAAADIFAASDCPLTVREGRSWLSGMFEGSAGEERGEDQGEERPKLKHTAIEDGKQLTETEHPAVLMKEVWFRYEKDSPDVLKGVDFNAPQGMLSAIVGGNGTGKSTALRAICGICRPYRGHVYINGQRIDRIRAADLFRNNLAMLPQDPQALFVKKTVGEELGEMNSAADRITDIAELCGITELMDRHPYDLSGGEQQRTALAKVLLTEPEILLLDEPTKGLDNFFKLRFADILKELKRRGVTVIMVSHDVEFCARYADRVSMFFDGGIITTNTPRKFFSQNSFYTTAANRMSRHLFENAVTSEDVVSLVGRNL